MKPLFLIVSLIILSSCGHDSNSVGDANLLYGAYSDIKIECVGISNTDHTCQTPTFALDQSIAFYYPKFPDTSFSALSPATLWLTINNTSSGTFSGTASADVYYSSSVTSYVLQTFSTDVNLNTSSQQTFSFLLSTPTASDSYGNVSIKLKNASGLLENKALLRFTILHPQLLLL